MDYFKAYFQYAGLGVSEPPAIFHRWVAVSIVGTLLGRQIWIPFGHSQLFPNQYIMFMGTPGSRKSTAINIGVKLLKAAGFTRFASDRTSKERFLIDMCQFDSGMEMEDLEMLTLNEPAETCIAADEFTDFIGNNNTEFVTMLTKLWDCPDEYTHPKIHGKSVVVNRPTINILSGNTAQGFALAFPVEALGNGFLSRILLVHGETTGRKITFPEGADDLLKAQLVLHLNAVAREVKGPMTKSPEANKVFDRIYKEYVELDDHRFKHYTTRRFTHILKLSMILAACDLRTEMQAQDVVNANTLLHITECNMPKALGEFGKSKYSDVTNSVLDILNHAVRPVTINELWKKVSKDLNKMIELADILKNLLQAERIQTVKIGNKGSGYLPLKKINNTWAEELLNLSWLTSEEQEQ